MIAFGVLIVMITGTKK
ncbi:hypothetical protein NO348_18125 [Hungatella hathewayi]|nr:hypothetical protein [Hungatella hathewayi]MCQ5386743.1 hypothetical protein [Hungatella hathewayi]